LSKPFDRIEDVGHFEVLSIFSRIGLDVYMTFVKLGELLSEKRVGYVNRGQVLGNNLEYLLRSVYIRDSLGDQVFEKGINVILETAKGIDPMVTGQVLVKLVWS
jgi:hypothetical protein